MKLILYSAVAALLFTAAPATGGIISVGASYAESCYRAAEARAISTEAINTCNKALEDALPPDDIVGTHVNRGVLFMISGDLRQANRDFDVALQLNPKQPEAWLNKAIAQFKDGNSGAAVQMADRAIRLGTRKPAIAYFVRGLANEDSGKLRAAYADLRHASALAPKWKEPALELARYQIRGR